MGKLNFKLLKIGFYMIFFNRMIGLIVFYVLFLFFMKVWGKGGFGGFYGLFGGC